MPEELSKDELLQRLGGATGFDERQFQLGEDRVSFEYHDAELEDGVDEDELKIVISGEEFDLTEDAYYEANKIIGLGRGYVRKTPVPYVVPHLNYWFDNLGEERKALIRDGRVITFIRPGTELYDLAQMIEAMCDTAEENGIDDYFFEKLYHTFEETQFSMVFRSKTHTMQNGDILIGGVQVQHSLLGKKPTVVSAYVHQDIAGLAGGMISGQNSNKWNRKLTTVTANFQDFFDDDFEPDPEGVYNIYTWMEGVTQDIINRINREFESILQLPQFNIGGHAGTFLNDVFVKYKVPTAMQRSVREEYTDQDGQTVYDLWRAIAAVSGRAEVADKPEALRRIMLVAGQIAAKPDKCPGCHRLTGHD